MCRVKANSGLQMWAAKDSSGNGHHLPLITPPQQAPVTINQVSFSFQPNFQFDSMHPTALLCTHFPQQFLLALTRCPFLFDPSMYILQNDITLEILCTDALYCAWGLLPESCKLHFCSACSASSTAEMLLALILTNIFERFFQVDINVAGRPIL